MLNTSNTQYDVMKTIDTSDWVDIKHIGFILDTWVLSKGEKVNPGEVYLDNISVDYEVTDVAVGQMVIATTKNEARLSIQLETSADLVTWTNAGSAVE